MEPTSAVNPLANQSSIPSHAQPASPSTTTTCRFWSILVQCNPFYLASALLLIYAVYRFSVDPNLFATDTRQLLFNFSALKLYSAMLVVAAVFLARRSIWYDSTLLFFLENILVLIPFMLISHAVFLRGCLKNQNREFSFGSFKKSPKNRGKTAEMP